MPIDATKATVFLSSTFSTEQRDGRLFDPMEFRKNLADAVPQVDVWAYEQLFDRSEMAPGPEILDRCVDGIVSCDLFVFLLTGRHGSGMDLGADRRAAVSYLEAELFTAVAAQKPIAVLMLRGAEPEPELRDVLAILRSAFPDRIFFEGDEAELFEHWKKLAGKARSSRSPFLAKLSPLVDALSLARTRSVWQQDLADPKLRFLDGWLGSAKGSPNLPLAQSLLDQVARGKGHGNEPLRYAARLTRLWTVLRELGKAGEAAAYGSELAPLWDRALGLWGGAASWFGLHGHLQLSPLAAINTQLDIRSRVPHGEGGDGRPPAGARASALYSLALRAGSRRVVHLKQTIALTTNAMASGQEAEMGLLDIRGAAHMRLRHFFQAEADFKKALAWRERQGANGFSTGDAMVQLAFARAFTRPLIGDLHGLDEGLGLMREKPDGANDRPFLARAFRKAAIAYTMAGRLGRARHAWKMAQHHAQESGALDQKDRFN